MLQIALIPQGFVLHDLFERNDLERLARATLADDDSAAVRVIKGSWDAPLRGWARLTLVLADPDVTLNGYRGGPAELMRVGREASPRAI